MSAEFLPPGWALAKFEEILIEPKADLVDGPFGSNLKSEEYVESGVPVLKIQNIKADRFVRRHFSYVTQEKAAELSRHSFVPGDLMITKLGDPLGLCCEVPKDFPPGVFVADLMRLRLRTNKISKRFVLLVINSQMVQNQFKQITKGTTRPRVNLTIVRSLEFPLPPLPEQKRIVAKIEELFSELEAGEESLRVARRQLGVYRQSLLKQAFEGKLTAKWRTKNSNKLESPATLLTRIQSARRSRYEQELKEWETELYKWKRADKSGDRPSKPREPEQPDAPSTEHNLRIWDLPSDWMWTQLGSVSFVTKLAGFEYTDYVRYHEDGDLKVLKAENAGRNGFRPTEFSRIKSETVSGLTRSVLHGGELLVVFVGAGTGNTARVPLNQSFFLGPNIAMARPDSEQTDTRFIELFLRSPAGHDLLLAASKAVAQPSLSMGTIRQVPIPLCSLPEQQKIVRLLDEQFEEIERNEREIDGALRKSEALRQAILKKAFTGRLVPHVATDEPASQLLARLRARQTPRPTTSKRQRASVS